MSISVSVVFNQSGADACSNSRVPFTANSATTSVKSCMNSPLTPKLKPSFFFAAHTERERNSKWIVAYSACILLLLLPLGASCFLQFLSRAHTHTHLPFVICPYLIVWWNYWIVISSIIFFTPVPCYLPNIH